MGMVMLTNAGNHRQRSSRSHRLAIDATVQHGTDPPFEAGSIGNRRRRHPHSAMPPKSARNVQQMFGVRAPVDSRFQDGVVARVLAFLAHLRTGNPQNRIEPVNTPQYFGSCLKQPVAPEHVRHLMREHDTDPIVGPRSSAGGQDHPRMPESPRHEQCRPIALQEEGSAT